MFCFLSIFRSIIVDESRSSWALSRVSRATLFTSTRSVPFLPFPRLCSLCLRFLPVYFYSTHLVYEWPFLSSSFRAVCTVPVTVFTPIRPGLSGRRGGDINSSALGTAVNSRLAIFCSRDWRGPSGPPPRRFFKFRRIHGESVNPPIADRKSVV